VTDAQLIDLGLSPRATPTPINPPVDPPVAEVLRVLGKTVTMKLHGRARGLLAA
jgi:hypothetical protein